MINDLLKLFLINPYLKRLHFLVRDQECKLIIERMWYLLEREIERLKKDAGIIQIEEYYMKPEEITNSVLKDVDYSKIKISGNDARKFSEKELRALLEKTLDSAAFLIRITNSKGDEKLQVFLPHNPELEWT